jgi:leader peptidase (prepilin peptidase) / N-methyltransferase
MTPPLLFLAGLLALTLIVAISDLRSMIIPDAVNLLIGLLGLSAVAVSSTGDLFEAILGSAFGAGLLLGLRAAHFHLKGVESLGLGDVKFVAAGGLWTGLEDLPAFLAIASLSGLGYAGLRWMAKTPIERSERVPFGPFLGFSLMLVASCRLLTGASIYDLLLGT